MLFAASGSDRWEVVERHGAQHIRPLADFMVHTGCECWCHPTEIGEPGKRIWLHHSADGREDEE
jgi:hypothetical protein